MLLSLPSFAQTYTVESVPNNKLINNSYVSDPNGLLQSSTVTRIDSALAALEKNTSAQVAVVMLPSIGDNDLFEFAQSLFVKWGIGNAGKDNGLLILYVQDLRAIRFHTGFGLEGVLPDATCKRIQQQYMVPSFRNGDTDTGMWEGVSAVAAILTTPEAADEILAQGQDNYGSGYVALMFFYGLAIFVFYFIARGYKKFSDAGDHTKIGITQKRWLILYVLIPYALMAVAYAGDWETGSFILLAYLLAIVLLFERYLRILSRTRSQIREEKFQQLYFLFRRQRWYWGIASVVFPIPIFFLYLHYRRKRNWFRNHPRACKHCGAALKKLSERKEDAFMDSGQITEEKIGVTDYDVWKCTQCDGREILSYPSASTRYSGCPACGYTTLAMGASRTLVPATYESSGSGELEKNCLHCGHHLIEAFTIPMLVASASSSSDSNWSSSSSDSGGDWGGGDSGGGGASSSW